MDRLCYLDDKSCGGCCCIEVPEDRKEDLIPVFRLRRGAYVSHLKEQGNVGGYEAQIATREELLSIDTLERTSEKKCHYLGFLDDQETRVGCLAHPEMNGGRDLRDCGFYKSARTCQDFFCAAAEIYAGFTPEQQRWFRISIRDWDWYDLSDQDKTYATIGAFRTALPRIQERIHEGMDDQEIAGTLRALLL